MTRKPRPGLALAALPLTLVLLAAAPAGAPKAAKSDPAVPEAIPGAGVAPAGKKAVKADPGVPEAGIVAVVNGDVISNADVANRARLFALSTGMGIAADTVDRLRPQITRQLVDERLRLQEIQRRHIVVSDKEIADAIKDIESRNGMPAGMLRAKLTADGVGIRTLVDQIRVQVGWTRVLRQQVADSQQITEADIDAQQKLLKQEAGRPEYRVSEIFIPIEDPANAADAQRFAETVIGELHGGANFPVAAAQFSQSQTALQGGDLGWVELNQLDPEVARVVQEMPEGAISNPLKVPGGLSIVTLRAKRTIGNDEATMVSIRQVFLPFATPLNPQAPTDAQRQALDRAKQISASVHSCAEMEQAAKTTNSSRAVDPGDIRLEGVNPPGFRQLLATLPPDKASQPLIAGDGIAIVIVCSRAQKNNAELSKDEVKMQLLSDRVELASRQLQQDLRRRAVIDIREQKVANGGS